MRSRRKAHRTGWLPRSALRYLRPIRIAPIGVRPIGIRPIGIRPIGQSEVQRRFMLMRLGDGAGILGPGSPEPGRRVEAR